MRIAFVNLTVCGFLILYHPLPAGQPAQNPETIRIAPASDGVEIERIKNVRCTALGAVKEADLTNMQIELWFSATWKTREHSCRSLVRLHSLSSIEDNTGKLLSTPERLKQIEYLRDEVRMDQWGGRGDKEGPSIRLLLDAPARSADKIKALKGKAEASLVKEVVLNFHDLSAINGKILDHPDMKKLKDLKLDFSIEEKNGRVTVRVKAPFNYASPWNRGRLLSWEVRDGWSWWRELVLSSEGKSPEQEGVTVEKTYEARSYKGWSLQLIILEPVETKTFDFDFRGVDLP
jgi:hypothetical protein